MYADGVRAALPPSPLLLAPFVVVGAALYASVGHGGATVYLAILTLAGYAVQDIVAPVLALNVIASGLAFLAFWRAGHLRADLLPWLLATSIPFAYLGGLFPFSGRAQAIVLGATLLLAGARLLLLPKPPNLRVPLRMWILPPLGAVLGFVAGATGIGGGIFLSPVLLAAGWTDVRGAAGVASAFIALNSVAGLAAKVPRDGFDVALFAPLALAVAVGALVGGLAGARRLPARSLQMLLGTVLLVAAAKALFL